MAANNQNLTSEVGTEMIEKIEQAVDALLKHKQHQSNSQNPQLIPQDDFFYIVLSLKKIPPKYVTSCTTPYKIPLPHSLFLHHSAAAVTSELCLIIDDRLSSNLTAKIAKEKIKNDGIPISKVVKLSKLKTDYKSFEEKRMLCDSYDLFFVDKRVVSLLPKLLGKQYFKKRKLPLTVNLSRKSWKKQIERLCSSALLYFRSGTCSVVRVGRVSMERDEIVENVCAAVDGIVEIVPKQWKGIRSLHLKYAESLSLPVYQALPDMKLKIEGIVSNNDDKGLNMDANVITNEDDNDHDNDKVGSEEENGDSFDRNELVTKKRKSGVVSNDTLIDGKKKRKGDLVKAEVDINSNKKVRRRLKGQPRREIR